MELFVFAWFRMRRLRPPALPDFKYEHHKIQHKHRPQYFSVVGEMVVGMFVAVGHA